MRNDRKKKRDENKNYAYRMEILVWFKWIIQNHLTGCVNSIKIKTSNRLT